MSVRTNHPMLDRIVSLEMCGLIQDWRFEGDAVHLIAALPASVCCCRVPHTWFVNRDGRTRCWECDAAYVKARAEWQSATTPAGTEAGCKGR